MGDLVDLVKEVNMYLKGCTAKEGEVFDIIIEYLDTLPPGFFVNHTLEELNRHFGGHGDMVVTENVRKALDAQQRCELMMDEMIEIYDSLAETDEDDEEADQ